MKKALILVPASSSEFKQKNSKQTGSMLDGCLDESQFEDYRKHVSDTYENFAIHEVDVPMNNDAINDFMRIHAATWIPLGNIFLSSLLSA